METELTRRVVLGSYKGPFQCMTYSLSYQGRAAMPSCFDCNLGYTIGYTAGAFIDGKKTGLMVDIGQLNGDASNWQVAGLQQSGVQRPTVLRSV